MSATVSYNKNHWVTQTMKDDIIGGTDSVFNMCKHIQERECVFLHVFWIPPHPPSSVGYLLYGNNDAKFPLEVVIIYSCFCRF